MSVILSVIIGYLIGSFPTGYILLKKYHSLDIIDTGSGNVGALNSYRVSRSILTGIVVFVIDFMKGFVSVLIIKIIYGNVFILLITSLAAAVLAHCYSPWIKFKGGRGLATAAGGGTIISIPIMVLWISVWAILFLLKRNIHFANIGAIIVTILTLLIPSGLKELLSKPYTYNQLEFSLAVTLIMVIMLTRHNISINRLIFTKNKKNQGI